MSSAPSASRCRCVTTVRVLPTLLHGGDRRSRRRSNMAPHVQAGVMNVCIVETDAQRCGIDASCEGPSGES